VNRFKPLGNIFSTYHGCWKNLLALLDDELAGVVPVWLFIR